MSHLPGSRCRHGSGSLHCGWCEDQADLAVAREQVTALRAALAAVLDAREKEAKAWFSYENARYNFTGGAALESRRHQAAMVAASKAEREARLLLLTLKAPKEGALNG